VSTTLSPALDRALDLLANPPAEPDVSKGYLDLLSAPTTDDADMARNTGVIQAAWASPIGSFLYDNAQALTRRFIASWQLPIDWLDIPPGGIALDVGSGPGSITTSLHGWVPPGITLPADIHLLNPAPAQRHRDGAARQTTPWLTDAPGDALGWASDYDFTDTSSQPRDLPAVDDLGWMLSEATHWRHGLPRMVNTLAKAGAAGTDPTAVHRSGVDW